MKNNKQKRRASALVLAVVAVTILIALGLGLLTVSYGVRHRAIVMKSEAKAMLAAEAGYEVAIFRMSQQPDMLSSLNDPNFNPTGALSFTDSTCNYKISFASFVESRPVYRILSQGRCGLFDQAVEVYVIQAVSGWDMGMCRVPSSSTTTEPVHYADGEILSIPIHVNRLNDSPDYKDIYISGGPKFLDPVEMGESRDTSGGFDKYDDVIDLFNNEGIYFNQPDSRITDEVSVAKKVTRLEGSTKSTFKLTPTVTAGVTNPQRAVQLEFFVEGGVGMVRVTNNCTVRGFEQNYDDRTWDYRIKPGSGGSQYERYPIYSYHVIRDDAEAIGDRKTYKVENTYVTQSYGEVESAPGGQIFVDGNVIIGGDLTTHNGDQLLKGKMTIVATGNIWVADSVMVDGERETNKMPARGNPNILGLISQGVIRVVDPGMSEYYDIVGSKPYEPSGFDYVPVARGPVGSNSRYLPDATIVEAAITVGGGGWGAENVKRGSYGGRKQDGGTQDKLIVRGTLSEAIRGVVGLIGYDGYLKQYYMDMRLLEGILPSDFWLKGKYIPAPAGWHDYRL